MFSTVNLKTNCVKQTDYMSQSLMIWMYFEKSFVSPPQSLDNARRQRKSSVTTVQKKGEELIEYCRSQGNIPVSLEQSLSNFTDRWNSVGSLIDDRRHKALLARRRREVQDLMITLEAVIKDVERVIHKFSAEVPDNEYEMKSQLELCKVSGRNQIPCSSKFKCVKLNPL